MPWKPVSPHRRRPGGSRPDGWGSRPDSRRHRPRLVHGRADRSLLRQGTGARRGAAADGHLFLRRPHARRRPGNGPHGRPRPARRDLRTAAHGGRSAARGRGPGGQRSGHTTRRIGSGELALAGNTEDVYFALAERGIVVRTLPRGAESPARAVARLALITEASPSLHAVAPDYGELPAVMLR